MVPICLSQRREMGNELGMVRVHGRGRKKGQHSILFSRDFTSHLVPPSETIHPSARQTDGLQQLVTPHQIVKMISYTQQSTSPPLSSSLLKP